MALVARILPRKEDSAKDFGIMNVANALPQSIVPAIAPLLLSAGTSIGIGDWTFFYLVLAIFTAIGMVSIKPPPEVGEPVATDNEAETVGISLAAGNMN